MNTNFKKISAFFFFLLFSALWPALVFSGNYQTFFAFEHELAGPIRSFEGQNIAFETHPKTYPSEEYPDATPVNNIYTVTLYRYIHWLHKDKIGTVTLPRNASGKAVWLNVGPGDYYLFFQKEKDRMVVTDDSARFYNF